MECTKSFHPKIYQNWHFWYENIPFGSLRCATSDRFGGRNAFAYSRSPNNKSNFWKTQTKEKALMQLHTMSAGLHTQQQKNFSYPCPRK
jgi:hypothetical protein